MRNSVFQVTMIQVFVGMIFFGVLVRTDARSQDQSLDSAPRFEEYISPLTNRPASEPPLLSEEYSSETGEAYLYGHHRGPGLKLVLADSVCTLAGIPVYPSITAPKGPVIPAPTAVVGYQFGDLQRTAWANGESLETIHEKAYQFLINCALVDSVCRTPSHGSNYLWEVWYKDRQGPTNLRIYDSMPPPVKTYTPSQKLRKRRQLARNMFDRVKRSLEWNPTVIVFVVAGGGPYYLPESDHSFINEILAMNPEKIRENWDYHRMPLMPGIALELLNPRPLNQNQK